MEWKFFINYLLRPHWKILAAALIAVIFEGFADILDPWPIKIVLDYVIGSKPMPQWAVGFVGAVFGQNKPAILAFAVVAVVMIAAVGAAATFTEKYLTTKVGQAVMCDLRRTA